MTDLAAMADRLEALAANLDDAQAELERTPVGGRGLAFDIVLTARDRSQIAFAEAAKKALPTILTALRASRPEPITGGPEIKLVEMQDWSQGYAQDAPPVWRVELGGYCADFEHEQAARNWADAIVRYASRPEPAAEAGRS